MRSIKRCLLVLWEGLLVMALASCVEFFFPRPSCFSSTWWSDLR